jgi:hypothetical protein
MVNVYVIKDPTKPENQGQVKVLRYGKQLAKIIDAAISGDDAEEYGERVFDLSANGCNLRIKVEENEGGYATYVASRFQSPSAIEGLDNPDDVYDMVKPLGESFKHLSYEEIKKILDRDWFGTVSTTSSAKEEDDDQEDAKPLVAPKKKAYEEESVTEMAEKDSVIDEILNNL